MDSFTPTCSTRAPSVTDSLLGRIGGPPQLARRSLAFLSSLPGSLCLHTLALRAALQLLPRKIHCLVIPRVLSTSVQGSYPFEVEPEAAPPIALATNQRMSTCDQKVPGLGQQLSAFGSWAHLSLDVERGFPGSASGALSKLMLKVLSSCSAPRGFCV